MSKKNISKERLKELKKTSRDLYSDYGKSGVHLEPKQRYKKSTKDYLAELDEDQKETWKNGQDNEEEAA